MYKENFIQRIKIARNNAGFTQQQVEHITGIKQSNIAKYENGTLEPDLEKLGALALAYKVNINWLLGICFDE